MMMVPPPWFISWVMISWDGAGASGDGIRGKAGVCIGRNVMVVVLRWEDIRCWALLSIEAAVMVVVFCCEVVSCLFVRQADIRRIDARMMVSIIGCVVFIVFSLCLSCVCTKIINL